MEYLPTRGPFKGPFVDVSQLFRHEPEVCVFRLVPTGLVDSMNEKTVGEPRAVTWMSQQISKWLVSGL